MLTCRRRLSSGAFAAFCGLLCFVAPAAPGVILLGTGDPNVNTGPPTRDLANSGWQYEGFFGAYLGTPIAPQFFITAKHVNGAGTSILFANVSHDLVEGFNDPYSDLTIWRVTGTFPTFAPLYSGADETGQRLVVIGRGTQRGEEVIKNGVVHGWDWGTSDSVRRWGENVVTSIVRGGPANDYVYATFDPTGPVAEAHLSSGDSGGAVYIREAGTWKLAGINYAVDGPYYFNDNGSGGFDGALFDTRDFYYQDSANPVHYTLIDGPTPVPSGFYSTRISSKRAWIYSVVDPRGDANGNGISNTVDYAMSLNLPEPTGLGGPTVADEAGTLSFTYRKLAIANAPVYQVQQSTDLHNWTTIAPQETVIEVHDYVQTIKALITSAARPLFLRVAISPP
jgi:hypothetical protein